MAAVKRAVSTWGVTLWPPTITAAVMYFVMAAMIFVNWSVWFAVSRLGFFFDMMDLVPGQIGGRGIAAGQPALLISQCIENAKKDAAPDTPMSIVCKRA